jgi:hypothetical protein
MARDGREDRERLRREAARIGIALPDGVRPLPHLGCCGHKLPDLFVWFCREYAGHSGFPHHGWAPPFGLLSPFGQPSDLRRRNAEVRRDNPNWPSHWVSFWHGGDGDCCFSFDRDGHPWIVYWYYNYGYHEENVDLEFRDDYEAADFVDWFAQQVEWALTRRGEPPAARPAG